MHFKINFNIQENYSWVAIISNYFSKSQKGFGQEDNHQKMNQLWKILQPQDFHQSFILAWVLFVVLFLMRGERSLQHRVLNRCARVVIVTMLWLYNLNGFMLHFQSPFTTYHNKIVLYIKKILYSGHQRISQTIYQWFLKIIRDYWR